MTAKVSKKNSFSTLSYQVLWLGSGIRPPRTIPLGPIKRVWVQPPFRGHHIATFMIRKLEIFAHEHGYRRTVLMTRERMDYAIKLYEGLGYKRIENYPPYQHMDDEVCYAKDLSAIPAHG